MADDAETGSLLDVKRQDSSPPPYSAIQSTTSPASTRNGLSHKCVPNSPATTATVVPQTTAAVGLPTIAAVIPATTAAVVRAPLLDDRVVSAVMRSVPPLERAFSVPDRRDSYVNVAVTVDDAGRAGRGSLKVTPRRCDSARSNKTADGGAAAAAAAVERMDAVAAGPTTTRRRGRRHQQSISSLQRAGSGTSINLSRSSYERLTGLELPPTPTPTPNDLPVTPNIGPVVVTVATPGTSPRPPPGSTPAVRSRAGHPRPPQPAPLPTIKMDENNVPQIDVAITPTSEYFAEPGLQTPMFTLGAPPPPRNLRAGSPACRLRRPLSCRHAADGLGTAAVSAGAGVQVPTLMQLRRRGDVSERTVTSATDV